MKRLLFITGNRLGDVVISTGLLRAYQKRYPEALVTIVCGPVAASLFDHWPMVRRVIRFEKKRFDLHWALLWLKSVPHRWDHVVDLRGSGLSYFLLCRRRSVMRGGRREGLRLHHLAALLNCQPSPLPEVFTAATLRAKARAILPGGSTWIALAPTANWAGKMWPSERFVALSAALVEKGYRIAVFYGPGAQEAAAAKPVIQALGGKAADLGGNHPLTEIVALLERCGAFVGNDSGLMHLAAAAGTPTLGLFGPSRASEYAPSGRHATFIAAEGPEGAGRMDTITVNAVLKAVCDLLRHGR